MNENLQCKDGCEKKQKHVHVLAETVVSSSQKLHQTSVSNREMRKRTILLLPQNKRIGSGRGKSEKEPSTSNKRVRRPKQCHTTHQQLRHAPRGLKYALREGR